MLASRRMLLLVLAVPAITLFGFFVWHGTLSPDPTRNHYPGEDELAAGDVEPGNHVSLSGTVTATDLVTIQVTSAHVTHEYAVRDAPDVDEVQQLRLFATYTDDGTLEAHELVVRHAWEATYMYAVSIVAALWILARIFTQWRFDPRSVLFVPASSTTGERPAADTPTANDPTRDEPQAPTSGGGRGG
ncbi:hypothetical protein [Natrialba sp. INN-245]|uniref:hypothetical protein n=1 Tax=Natrialba sp. INN-245 TaxID=2690967 RepID=UPI0013136D20|nr:hypothetical protein [Natrialba sp. INN-245]MWV40057.1 hypothetical protein [Natrialba sp. INN-245]